MSAGLQVDPVADVLEYRPPNERDHTTAWLGMVFFLASWAMMFAGLFFAYGGVRARAELWPPPATPIIPLLLPTINTAGIILSSVLLHVGIRALKRGQAARLAPAMAGTLILAVLFMAFQTWIWIDLYGAGLRPSSGPYGSVFYGLTAIHAAHVIVGLGALAWLTVQAFRGAYTPARYLQVRLWAMYWHFVGAIWLFLFVTVYVL